ncbi:MAG: GIY-YIG nuclease family protein [Opitutales bacterium]
MAGHIQNIDSKLPEKLMRVECPEPVEGLFWIYILLMRNGMFYVGQTGNVAERLKRHANG